MISAQQAVAMAGGRKVPLTVADATQAAQALWRLAIAMPDVPTDRTLQALARSCADLATALKVGR